MTVELQPVFNLAISALVGVAVYFFKKVQNHETRIQKVEDIFAIKFEHLIKEIDDMKAELKNLSHMVHKQAGNEVNLRTAVDLMVSELKEYKQQHEKN